MGLPTIIISGINIIPLAIDFVNFYALYLAIAASLNLEFGYGGVPNFGKVLFIAGGAAVAAQTGRLAAAALNIGTNLDFITFNARIVTQVNTQLVSNPLLAIELVAFALPVAALVGAVLGWIFSYPAIRLREDYLGLLLLGMAQLFNVILRTYPPLMGGAQPIFVPDIYVYFSTLGLDVRDLAAAVVMVVFAVAVYLYVERTVRSPLGRTLRAVRDNDKAAQALGKDPAKLRRNVLIVSSALAAMAGAMYTFSVASAEYDTWTRFAWTFWPFLIVIIGGVANNAGVAVGTFFFTLIFRGLQTEQQYLQPYVFFNVNYLQDFLLAGLLLAILYIRPDGILREKPTRTLSRGTVLKLIGKGGTEEGGGQGLIGRVASRLKRGSRRTQPANE